MFGCRATTLNFADISGLQVNTGMFTAVLEISTPSYQAKPADFWQAWGRRIDPRVESAYVLPNCIPGTKRTVTRWEPNLTALRRAISVAKDRGRSIDTGNVLASTPGPNSDPLDQLRRLGELRSAGVLTEAEFEAKKAEILARI